VRNPWAVFWNDIKTRREEWQPVLTEQVEKWSAMSDAQILSKLPAGDECFEVEFESKRYPVELSILENTAEYLHVVISVDDGSLPASLRPISSSFICKKNPLVKSLS